MKSFLLSSLLLLLWATNVLAQQPAVFAPAGQAIRGYDPVTYFTKGQPVKGSPDYTHTWQGATWLFANEANRDSFKAQPERFAPQYGGYCAYGMSKGYQAPTEPDAWTIQDGKLYLNYNQEVRTQWNKDRTALIGKADVNWPKVKSVK